MSTEVMNNAKKAKNDEFYTQYADIETEIMAYIDYNKDVFRGKTILLPCDDPEWSNFTKFFAQNFQRLGIKKLISTSYATESKKMKAKYEPTLFETTNPQFDKTKTIKNGKIFTLTRDVSGDGKIDVNDLEWKYLHGDGDFRSGEIIKLRNEADIIVTNPPFSLFREFLAWIVEAKKEFVILGNMNAISYKEVFPLLKNNEIWLGVKLCGSDTYFRIPKEHQNNLVTNNKEGSGYVIVNSEILARVQISWFTNLDHGRRHEHLSLMTMEENLKYSKHKEIKGKGYQKYDNYDAIEVPFVDAIPSDYEGVMGVPISFLSKYSPDQFEILGNEYDLNIGKSRGYINGKRMYSRVFIKHKR